MIKKASFRGDIHLKKRGKVMPPRKQLHTMKVKSEKGNEACGSGSQSRIASWRIMHFSPVFSWLQDRQAQK